MQKYIGNKKKNVNSSTQKVLNLNAYFCVLFVIYC